MSVQNNKLMNLADGKALYTDIRQRLNNKEDKPGLVVNFTIDSQAPGWQWICTSSDKTDTEIMEAYDSGKTIKAFATVFGTTEELTNVSITRDGKFYWISFTGQVFVETTGYVEFTINANGTHGWGVYGRTALKAYDNADAYYAYSKKIKYVTDPTDPQDAATKNYVDTVASEKIDISQKGAASGVAELDSAGKVPSSQLPSYIDDVRTYETRSAFPQTGEDGIIYVAKDTNITYRWGGEAYVPIGSDLALGETASTAYRGDRGKIAYDHAMVKGSAFASGLYKIATNSEGHVTGATPVVKKDITDLGIPEEAPNEVTVGPTEPQDETKLWVDTDETGASYSVPTMAEFNALDAAKADKTDTVLNSTLSMGRKAETTVGEHSVALGDNNEASGKTSQAFGLQTISSGLGSHAVGLRTTASNSGAHSEGTRTVASGQYSHTEGAYTVASDNSAHAEGRESVASGTVSHAQGLATIANASIMHASGMYNVGAVLWPEWVSGTEYSVGDRVTYNADGCECIEANSDEVFTRSKWKRAYRTSDIAFVIGNGESDSERSNAVQVDWDGNERLAGDVYVGCNNDSTGGHKLISTANVATIAEMQAIIDEYDAEVGA